MSEEKANYYSKCYPKHPGIQPKDLHGHMPYHVGTAATYLARAGHKPGAVYADDIKKAWDHLGFELERLGVKPQRTEQGQEPIGLPDSVLKLIAIGIKAERYASTGQEFDADDLSVIRKNSLAEIEYARKEVAELIAEASK